MSDNKKHPRSKSEREYFTQQYIPAGQDRRFSADDEAPAHVEHDGSRPIPLPRRANPNTVQSPRNGPERQDVNTWTNSGVGLQGSRSFESGEVERLQAQVSDSMREQKRLLETIEIMKKREEDMNLREQTTADRERDMILKESQMDSKYSDKEFELNQKRRDLQLLEDQLHMKNKDLQHREFDLQNADGPEDISSSKMADLADRTFELDKQEEELKRKQEYFDNWERKLDQDNVNYQGRMSDLQRREADMQGFMNMAPANRGPAHHQLPYDQHCQEPQYSQDWTERAPVTSSPRGPGVLHNLPSEVRQEPAIQQMDSVDTFERRQSEPFPDNPMLPPSPPQNEPIFLAPAQDFIDHDMALAKQLAEEEQRKEQERREQSIIADQLLALQLQDEDLRGTDPVSQLSAGAGDERTEDVIKQDLGSRLTQEQFRQRREREDYLYAQNLVDEANNSDSNN